MKARRETGPKESLTYNKQQIRRRFLVGLISSNIFLTALFYLLVDIASVGGEEVANGLSVDERKSTAKEDVLVALKLQLLLPVNLPSGATKTRLAISLVEKKTKLQIVEQAYIENDVEIKKKILGPTSRLLVRVSTRDLAIILEKIDEEFLALPYGASTQINDTQDELEISF